MSSSHYKTQELLIMVDLGKHMGGLSQPEKDTDSAINDNLVKLF